MINCLIYILHSSSQMWQTLFGSVFFCIMFAQNMNWRQSSIWLNYCDALQTLTSNFGTERHTDWDSRISGMKDVKNDENVVVERRLMKQNTDGILVPQNSSQSLRPEGANLVFTILYFQRIILQIEHLLDCLATCIPCTLLVI